MLLAHHMLLSGVKQPRLAIFHACLLSMHLQICTCSFFQLDSETFAHGLFLLSGIDFWLWKLDSQVLNFMIISHI